MMTMTMMTKMTKTRRTNRVHRVTRARTRPIPRGTQATRHGNPPPRGGGNRGDEGWEWSQDGPPLLPISKNNQIIFWPGKRGEYLWAFAVADQWKHVPGGQRVRQLGRNTPQGEDQPRPIARGTQGQLRKVKGEDVWVMAVTGVATAEEEEETEPGEQPKEHVPLQQGQLARVDPDIYRTSRITPLPMKPRQGDQRGPDAPQPNYQQGGASSSGHQQPPSQQQQQPHPQNTGTPPATQAYPQQSGSRPSDPAPKRKPAATPPTMPAPPPTPPPPSEQATKRHKPQLDARARGATTAATYIQAALEALQEHTTGTQATTDAVTNTLQSGHSHLTNALECLQAWTGEGGATGVQLVNNHTEDMEPGGGEEPASSSTRPRGRLAEQRPPSPINNPDSSNPPPPRPAQDNDTTATGGWTHHTGGTTNFEEAIRLAQHVRMGWGALNAEERIQDVGAILGLLRQGRRWLGTVVRTSSWALQSMAEARAPQAEQELLIAASYPTHPQASHHLQQAQHHMEACLGGEASALATQHNREAEGGEVHPADALALAAGGEEAPPGPNPGNQLQPTGHPIVRARHILQRLMPFTGGEVQEQLEAALQALNEWCHNLWGADLLAIEDTPEPPQQPTPPAWPPQQPRPPQQQPPPRHTAPPPPPPSTGGEARRRRGGSEGAARVGAATRGGHAGEGAAEAGGETNQRDRDLLPDRDNGREKIEAIVTLEAEGGTGGATSSEQGIDGGAPLTPPTQAWQPPPPSSYPQPQTMRRRWEAQMGIAANRRRSKQRRRLAFGQRTRRSRSGGSSYQYKHLTTEAGEEEEDEAGDEDETHRRRRTEPPGGIDLLNVAEEHRRRRAHAGVD